MLGHEHGVVAYGVWRPSLRGSAGANRSAMISAACARIAHGAVKARACSDHSATPIRTSESTCPSCADGVLAEPQLDGVPSASADPAP